MPKYPGDPIQIRMHVILKMVEVGPLSSLRFASNAPARAQGVPLT